MYSTKNNLLIGFHGCDESIRDALLTRPHYIHKSERPFDWLGHGVYFWENNYDRALAWAKDKARRGEIKKPSVIGAVISLKHCFDLLDNQFIDALVTYYNLMVEYYNTIGKNIPENKDAKFDKFKDKLIRELDCAVLEFMHQKISEKIEKDVRENGFSTFKNFDSVRGVFTEGGPAFEGAGIQKKSHIQICIRNPNCIKGFFLPRKEIEFQ
ncbi:hypothetical protein [Maribacter sp. 2304DJ31-5]|uniref:hypothetical protein n=1 Tax=Maribacter sp. 2304DJ31-5 TaxID=3386273 RepID=UPI0039BD3AFB